MLVATRPLTQHCILINTAVTTGSPKNLLILKDSVCRLCYVMFCVVAGYQCTMQYHLSGESMLSRNIG